jgi:hypothetical protein
MMLSARGVATASHVYLLFEKWKERGNTEETTCVSFHAHGNGHTVSDPSLPDISPAILHRYIPLNH